MRYLGGKVRQAPRIAKAINEYCPNSSVYWEPFMGGCSVSVAVAKTLSLDVMYLSDNHEDLVLLWKSLLYDGWIPPVTVSKEEYEFLKSQPPSALRGWIGFAASYCGKWWGGYGPTAPKSNRDYLEESQRLTLKKASTIVEQAIKNNTKVSLIQCSYLDIDPQPLDIVYLDPPYADTTEYKDHESFDTNEFWNRADTWSNKGCKVFVSEYKAPEGWVSILDVDRKSVLSNKDTVTNVEGLFVKIC